MSNTASNIILALDLATSLGERLVGITSAIARAHADGRTDLSGAELDVLVRADDQARAALELKIAAKRAAG